MASPTLTGEYFFVDADGVAQKIANAPTAPASTGDFFVVDGNGKAWKRVFVSASGDYFHDGILAANKSAVWIPADVLHLFGTGSNAQYQLGIGDAAQRTSPTQIGSDAWIYAAHGGLHGMAIRADGALFSFGTGFNGQLGLGGTTVASTPQQVGSDTDWTGGAISEITMIALRNGLLYGTGYNYKGLLGLGGITNVDVMTRLGNAWGSGISYVVGDIVIGTDNRDYRCTQNHTSAGANEPISGVSYGSYWSACSWISVSGSYHSTIGILGGRLYGCGYNNHYNLGVGDATQRLYFIQLNAYSDWTHISVGNFHSLGIRSGQLWAWGINDHGQLGTGDTATSATPVQIGTDEDWECVAAGYAYSAAIRAGRLFVWGRNDQYQLGLGDTVERLSPVQIDASTDWDDAYVSNELPGGNHAIRSGRLFAWGNNDYGQLGTGDTATSATPVQIGTDATWISGSQGAKLYGSSFIGLKS